VIHHDLILSFPIELTHFISGTRKSQPVASGGQGGFFEKPHCVGGHLQGKDGVRCFAPYVASMDIFFRRTAGAPGPPEKLFIVLL